MNALLPNKIEGYMVRKQAKDVKIGDIVYCGNFIVVVKSIEFEGSRINLCSEDKVLDGCDPKVSLTCIQKEDPVIQIAIEKKLELLRKNNQISNTHSGNQGHKIKEGPFNGLARFTGTDASHIWVIMETSGEFEYWKDETYDTRVLWKGNKIVDWAKDGNSIVLTKEVAVIDYNTIKLPKYIWR